MFDFEKLEVYNEVRSLNKKIFKEIIFKVSSDPYLMDQLKRAQVSVLLNLSEGTGRMTKPDKKRFYVTSRGSLNEVISILQILLDLGQIPLPLYEEIYAHAERISKMLLGMIRSMSGKI